MKPTEEVKRIIESNDLKLDIREKRLIQEINTIYEQAVKEAIGDPSPVSLFHDSPKSCLDRFSQQTSGLAAKSFDMGRLHMFVEGFPAGTVFKEHKQGFIIYALVKVEIDAPVLGSRRGDESQEFLSGFLLHTHLRFDDCDHREFIRHHFEVLLSSC